MKVHDLQHYFNRHCRLKLKSGKEVFGVLWGDDFDEEKLFFASNIDHKAYRQALDLKQLDRVSKLRHEVDPEEIIAVDELESAANTESAFA
jgi:hypothetical protein